MKDKNHTIVSVDVDETFNKIQPLLMIKTLNKVVMEGIYLNTIKVIYDKFRSQNYTQQWKVESFPSKIGNKTGMPL